MREVSRLRIVAAAAIVALAAWSSACGDDHGKPAADAAHNPDAAAGPDATPGPDAAPGPDGGPPPDCSAVVPVVGIPTLAADEIANNLDGPVDVKSPPDDARVFVVEQPGRIKIVDRDDHVLAKPFLDVTTKVSAGGERGLLGLAFHPKYAQNGRFFVYYSNLGGDIVIAEGKVDAQDANKASAAPLTVLLTIEHSEFGNHNGGWLDFGPDGKLYAGVGDGGAGDDPYRAGQDKKTLLAKILRLDVDIAAPYIPADNPFAGAGGGVRGEIWAFGVRNPWRNSFDRKTGDLYIADVGQNAYEELDVQPAGSTGGTNYGWSDTEGNHCYLVKDCTMSSYTPPVFEYEHPKGFGGGSITGGYVYRGCKMPDLAGTYFFADFSLDRFQSLKWNGASGITDLKSYPQFAGKIVTTFGQDRNGEILFVDFNQGRLYRMVPAP